MRNALIMGLLVVLIWAAVEVTTKGVSGAFGGVFAGWVASGEEKLAPAQRAADAYQRGYDRSTERVDRQLESTE